MPPGLRNWFDGQSRHKRRSDMKKRRPSDRFYRFLLRLFPFDFQREFGSEMEDVFRQQNRDASRKGIARRIRLWWTTIRGFFKEAPIEHFEVLRRDIVYGIRSLRKTPTFAFGAIS